MKRTEILRTQSRQWVCVAVFLSAALSAATAQTSPTVQRGLNLALANCARCHSIDKVSPSPFALAPPFRDLHLRYPVEDLAESLAEGIVTSHQNMPEFRLDPGQVGDFIDFLKSL
ncbi:MAG: cytochrome c [Hyphomicrobiales bacterium]|jgi:mono/diheme cytochrome c family protein|nr:cytochrome c [Hyphomicrobiales bacterium]